MTTPSGFAELHELAGEAARYARIFSVEQDEAQTFSGQDETGLVRVDVNAAGRVTDVDLDAEWDRTIDARMLGAAVIEAVNAATVTRLSAWADRVAEAADEPVERTPAPAPQPITINPSGQMVEQMLYLLHRVGQEIKPPEPARGRARDYDDEDDVPAPVRKRLTKGKSEGGHVVVGLDGTTVAEVNIETDTMWVGGANHLEVSSELRDAFAAAYARADEQAAAPRTDSAVAELRALTADPQEFVNKLFGLDR